MKISINKKYLIRTAAIIMVLLAAGSLDLSSHGQSREKSPAPPKFALLVGINRYQSKTINSLRGTHNDVRLMKGLLREYGFREDLKAAGSGDSCGIQTAASPLKTLCSEEATRKGILDAFDRHLIENARRFQAENKSAPNRGAAIVFYYSGHGSTLPDDNGDEPDGLDETLVPSDSDDRGSRDIRDDELAERLERLRKYTTNITFIVDSCFSGTITRGGGQRSVPREFGKTRRGEFLPPRLNDGLLEATDYVAVSASLPNEKSQEDYFTDPVTRKDQLNGAMTYFLVNLLRQYPDSTYREIINRVRNAVVSLGKDQTPQAEGDLDRTVFGSAGQREKVPIFPVCNKQKGKMVCSEVIEKEGGRIHRIALKVGRMIGARTGGAIAVYSPQAKDLTGEALMIGGGTIIGATEFASEAEVVLTDKAIRDFPENAKIVIASPNFTDEKRIVALDLTGDLTSRGAAAAPEKDPGVIKIRELEKSLRASDYLRPLETSGLLGQFDQKSAVARDWDVAVVRATYRDFLLGNRQPPEANAPEKNEQGYFLTDRSGMPLYNFWISADEPGLADALKEALERHVRLENLRSLANETSGIGEKLKVELVRLKDFEVLDEDAPACRPTPVDDLQIQKDNSRALQLRAGDKYYLRISNRTGRDLFIYIYSLAADGKINLLYPPENADEVLKNAQSVNTFGANGCRVFYIAPEDLVFGKETIKLIASTESFPAGMLTSPAIAEALGARTGSPLIKILKQAATNRRGANVYGAQTADWGTVNFDFEIVG
ncbi:MAG: caspase family protein [Pyrinomonadaceae bacterium]